ncbi:uncharacterized protein LOC143235748 [Tachypleus tridentatus]|uniref:uncharacterized protein LOC143235748 n=1 Tax=Tachypleus tridentatus TaxID=6853 RepID=UPI003FD57AD0
MTESERSGEWTQLHLNLYNFDTSEAQECPYVLTSPRSLEACSRVGVRPVQLLQKSLVDFEDEYGSGRTKDEVLKLYQDYEANRLRNLEKCRDERQKIILTAWEKQRSQSLSPKNIGMKNQGSFPSSEKITGTFSTDRDSSSERNDTVTISTSSSGIVPGEQMVQSPRAQSTPKNRPKSSTSTLSVRDINVTSFSVPSSPYRYLFEEKVSPASSALLKSKLCDSPRAKTKLYPKDIKLMELMVKRYQYRIEEEEKKAEAKRKWDKELQDTRRKQEESQKHHQMNMIIKSQRQNTPEVPVITVICVVSFVILTFNTSYNSHLINYIFFSFVILTFNIINLKSVFTEMSISAIMEMYSSQQHQKEAKLQDEEMKHEEAVKRKQAFMEKRSHMVREKSVQRKKSQERALEDWHEKKNAQQWAHLVDIERQLDRASKSRLQKDFEKYTKLHEHNMAELELQEEIMRLSRYDMEQRRKNLELKEEKENAKKQKSLEDLENSVKRHANELNRKIQQARFNQQELDQALAQWRKRVAMYQETANRRALEKAAENVEVRRNRIHCKILTKEKEHKKNMKRIEEEDRRKLEEMLERLRSKEQKAVSVTQDRENAIHESRAASRAASELRDLLRHKLDEEAFVYLSQHVALESRLRDISPRWVAETLTAALYL